MPNKRKRDVLDGFDPNQSDPDDLSFDPRDRDDDERPVRASKNSRSSKSKSSGGTKRKMQYRDDDIVDGDMSENESEASFAAPHSDGEDQTPVMLTSTGRRARNAAVKHKSYIESSVSDDEEAMEVPAGKNTRSQKKIVVLKFDKANTKSGGRGRRAKNEPLAAPSTLTRRATRARTEELDDHLMELTNSGRHMRIASGSKSKSPEALMRLSRATRGAKGLKKGPVQMEEANQELEPKMEAPNHNVREAVQGEDMHVPDPAEAEAAADGEIQDSAHQGDDDNKLVHYEAQPAEDDEEDDGPVTRRTRSAKIAAAASSAAEEEADDESQPAAQPRRLTRGSRLRGKKPVQEPSSDFEPGDESGDGEGFMSEGPAKARNHNDTGNESSTTEPRGRSSRARGARARTRRGRRGSNDEDLELDKNEMAEELEELRDSSRSRRPRRRRQRSPSIVYEMPAHKRRRTTKPVNYSIPPIDLAAFEEPSDAEPNKAATTARNRRGGKSGNNQPWERTLNTTYGPFGGAGAGALLGGPWGTGAAGGVDSDSSDDEMGQRSGVGGMVGITPATGLFGAAAPTHGEGLGGLGATPSVGKVKNQKAFADADPLGVDMNVDFSKVGGLQGHIDQLKEMVQLPLLYPELFQRFHVTPPRGVLFHGPPGTGKTLLARALANSIGSGGRKITFYMRKGADALSKWVGEAEKQLRLLFEEARRTQPSIIFFDEIDGLAPVRSSKQEQIHASIVSTLLALMDGMDGRGQVIVIGATNRPDNIDPALRRPGRFDREFYFPLPDVDARRSIIEIHTKDWGISDRFKDNVAENTKGFGGADLRAMCTEAALNAIQRTYPQIYSSKEKLVVDPAKIEVHATDFTLSMKKMVPSSQRSTTSAAAPLSKSLQPLLRNQYKAAVKLLEDVFPPNKKITALEEAMFEPYNDDDHGFGREAMHQEFERCRVFRPRFLIGGEAGMGQQYLASAILHHLERVHVQNFDLATLLGDGRPVEQVIVGLFTEVKRHKPSVVYIPHVDCWWEHLGDAAHTTFTSMLRALPPTDPVLVLATADAMPDKLPADLMRHVFGYSKRNRAVVGRPGRDNRFEFFQSTIDNLKKTPKEFPDAARRKKRVLDELPVAPPPKPKPPTKAEIKVQRKADLLALNVLKNHLQPIMDQIHRKYRKLRNPVIAFSAISHLFDEAQPNFVRPDLVTSAERRPYEIAKDKHNQDGIRDTANGKFFYNLETTTIEERLANGYYARPSDFYEDIKKLRHDAKSIGDRDRYLKTDELCANVDIDVANIEAALIGQGIRFEDIYQRQLRRAEEAEDKAKKRAAMQAVVNLVQSDVQDGPDSDGHGPVGFGLINPAPASTTTARFQPMSPGPEDGAHPTAPGSHALTNGHSVPSRSQGHGVEMGGVEGDMQRFCGPQALGAPSYVSRRTSSAMGTAGATQMSQASALTSLPLGVSPSAVLNDASTTKTSDLSLGPRRVSGSFHTPNINGVLNHEIDPSLLETQSQNREAGASGPWLPSHHEAIMSQGHLLSYVDPQNSPSRKSAASLGNILNDEAGPPPSKTIMAGLMRPPSSGLLHCRSSDSQASDHFVVHETQIAQLHRDLADETSGCTVEQLEQINRELMEELWRTRHKWNRVQVVSALTGVFNEAIRDIQEMQGSLPPNTQGDEAGPYVWLI